MCDVEATMGSELGSSGRLVTCADDGNRGTMALIWVNSASASSDKFFSWEGARIVTQNSKNSADPLVASIETVLEAERAVEQRLAECRRQADSIRASARQRAAAIGQRTDERISKLHTSYMKAIDAQIAELSRSSDDAVNTADEQQTTSRIVEVARRLANKMTSDSSE